MLDETAHWSDVGEVGAGTRQCVSSLDVRSLISAGIRCVGVPRSTLSQSLEAARVRVSVLRAELATQTATEAGLAWASQLVLAIGVLVTPSQLHRDRH